MIRKRKDALREKYFSQNLLVSHIIINEKMEAFQDREGKVKEGEEK